jgi:peroxiredoxin
MKSVVMFAALVLSACAHPQVLGAVLPPLALPGTDGVAHELVGKPEISHLTVLVFFAQSCPCQAAHDARLTALAANYKGRGVDVFAVDPEPGASAERDAAEARRRGYPFPILLDRQAALARRLGAEYATETFVVDRQGVVRYHGGIDSDKNTLHEDARPYLREALDDLLAGHVPRVAEGKALGCALQLW